MSAKRNMYDMFTYAYEGERFRREFLRIPGSERMFRQIFSVRSVIVSQRISLTVPKVLPGLFPGKIHGTVRKTVRKFSKKSSQDAVQKVPVGIMKIPGTCRLCQKIPLSLHR